MKIYCSLLVFSLFFYQITDAQTRYLVQLKNKGGTPFTLANPAAYLSQKSIERRTKYNIPIDSTDLPVTPAYITQIDNVNNVTILNVSKWLNSISILAPDPSSITTIMGFPFVQSVMVLAPRPSGFTVAGKLEPPPFPSTQNVVQTVNDYYNYGANAYAEIHLHNGEFLHNIGLRGQGMTITMLDGGFFNYNTLKAFDSVNLNGQVLSTWDFVDRNTSVTEDNEHGMQTFSTIAANIPGQFVGKAPKASFHLYRTEDTRSEYPIEEHNWACGAERGDSTGTDVLTSSLGYTIFDIPGYDHDYTERNGDIAMATIAADLAAKKGILVFNSVGNIIDPSTHFLSVPSDGDSVIAVGSVTPAGVVASNSSYGPSADGRIKPDVASVGAPAVVQSTNNTIGSSSGTSFACPSMAGMTTCLWQGFPEYHNMKIADAIRRAGSKFSAPDDRIGYGIPDMKLAFSNLLIEFATSSVVISNCTATLSWRSKDVSAMKYEIERKLPGEANYSRVGTVTPTSGDMLVNRNYQFDNIVISPIAGNISYRVRQIIDTATASFKAIFIDTANVSISSGCFATGNPDITQGDEIIIIQPNPVNTGNATVVIETPYAVSNLKFVLQNNLGQTLYTLTSSKSSGKKTFQIPVTNLSTGIYYLKVHNNFKLLGSRKLVKL